MTLRDELAAVLGPGNDDATAYAQADAVLEILSHIHIDEMLWKIATAMDDARYGPYPPT